VHSALTALHVLAALLWLGELLFLGVVGAPALQQPEPALRAQLFEALGVRLRTIEPAASGVLMAHRES